MIKYMITAIIIATSINVGATDPNKGFKYKKHYKKCNKWKTHLRRDPNCRITLN